MESITHIVLGAALGEVIAGKKIGKKAMLIGAIANSFPDADFIAGLWMPPTEYFLAHRGFTHSFLFVLLGALLLPFLVNYFKTVKMNFTRWALFFLIQLLTHILLDSLNAYGVAWFEPFSRQRFSFDVLFVADPFFSIWLVISCVALLILKSSSAARMKWAISGLVVSCLYIVYAMSNKTKTSKIIEASLLTQRIPAREFLTTPTPLNSWLWYVVAPSREGYWIGYYSVFDSNPSVDYHYFSRNDSLLTPFLMNEETNRLTSLSRGYYVVQQKHDTIVFNNLRFGQMDGWEKLNSDFVFQYYLGRENSLFTVQRGRFADWDKKKAVNFLKRIEGN